MVGAGFDIHEQQIARRFQRLRLPQRNVANLLSLSNLLCGIAAIVLATQHEFALALLASLIGAAFDGVDGAAARRFGGTRFGVLADDIADAVNFAFAPATALAVVIGGPEGVAVGVAYAALTLGRLVFFTIRKDACDPGYFDGAPSTIGAVVVLSSAALFADRPVLIGLFAGVAVAQMVSFGTAYRHLGRLVAKKKGLLLIVAPVGLALAIVAARFGPEVPAAVLLVGCLGYGFQPVVRSFRRALAARAGR